MTYSIFLRPLGELYASSPATKRMAVMLTAIAFAILFAALMNYVLLVISSMVTRSKDVAIHKCYGATGWNISQPVDIRRLLHTPCIRFPSDRGRAAGHFAVVAFHARHADDPVECLCAGVSGCRPAAFATVRPDTRGVGIPFVHQLPAVVEESLAVYPVRGGRFPRLPAHRYWLAI